MRIVLLMLALLLGGFPADAQPFLFDLEAQTPPDLPPDWGTSGSGWATSESSASPGSGGVNLVHTGSSAGALELPAVSLSGTTSGTFSFLARRTSSYPADSLIVRASIDSGASYPVAVVRAADLPAASSTWELVSVNLPATLLGQSSVQLRFDGFGGTSGGSNIRIDDVQLELEGGSAVAVLGFEETEIQVNGGTEGVVLPIGVHVPDDVQAQGLQIDVSWSGPVLSFASIERGPAVASTADWLIESSEDGQVVRMLVLATGDESIQSSTAAPLVGLVFQAGAVSVTDTTTVSIDHAILASASPDGADLPFTINVSQAALIVRPRAGILEAPGSVDFGSIYADEALNDRFLLSNGSETDTLYVSQMTAADSAWSLSPESIDVPPSESREVLVHFEPMPEASGAHSTVVTLVHDGRSTAIDISVLVLATLGDADGDRTIDVADVLLGVDFVLGRSSGQPETLRRLDLFPFPDGDGELDVRDLTVLIRAILTGIWPNQESIGTAGKVSSFEDSAAAARLIMEAVGDERILSVLLPEEVRAVQAELTAARPAEAIQGFFASAGSVWAGVSPGGVRFLWLSLDGEPLGPGSYELGRWPRSRSPFGATPDGDGIVVEMDMTKAPLAVGDIPADPSPSTGPYPNPYRLGSGVVRMPDAGGYGQEGLVEIWDILGRLIWRQDALGQAGGWNGQDLTGRAVSPGLYFIRTAQEGATYPLTVIR